MITQADIDSALTQIEALRGPLDEALRVDTRILDTEIRNNIRQAVVQADLGTVVTADLLARIYAELNKRANPEHTDLNPDADKRLHMRERQFGAAVKQIVNRLAAKL
jgi:hypothetical protein